MAAAHGKTTVLTIATKDISLFTKTSNYERTSPEHATTGYGVDDETYLGGVRKNTFTCGGAYDNTALVGPRIVLHAVVGTVVVIVRKVEGAGTGKPQDTFSAVVTKYAESNPYDDIVSWSAEFTITGPIVTIAQP